MKIARRYMIPSSFIKENSIPRQKIQNKNYSKPEIEEF